MPFLIGNLATCVFSWLGSSTGSGLLNRRGSTPARPSSRKLRLELLETRELLTASVPGFATPYIMPYRGVNGVAAVSASPTGYAPAQIRHAYGFDALKLPGGLAADGSGTTIAIVDAYDDPNIANDLHQFDLAYGLPDPVLTKVSQTGGTADLPAPDAGWITEIALDVEWAHAIAPKAKILLVEADSASLADLMFAVDYARNAPGVVTVSMSWGGSEFAGEQVFDFYFTAPKGHAGETFVAASGDTGAPVSYPAVSPNVLSVGGTTLTLDATGNYQGESGWSGSGGGISTMELQPAYQQGRVPQTTKFRANPDVAYDADPRTGFSVYDSYNNPASTPWRQWGGTSDAAPQWAALIAIADQARALEGKGPLIGAAQTLSLLYSLPSGDFHDITSGTSNGTPPYSAGNGYDTVTGRGTPLTDAIVAGLTNVSTPNGVTHFSISAPAKIVAGAAFGITVKALNRSNAPFGAYRGTVDFTSSDSRAIALGMLPADYTFTNSDNGVHTFTGVALASAGTQWLATSDISNSLISGRVKVSVRHAAASQLAFARQPVTMTAGIPISPAVKVAILDAFGNLVGNDNRGTVTLALGEIPAGGMLRGTRTARIRRGVATFRNLFINPPGTGYTLVANSGTFATATSARFDVQANKRGLTPN